jgi:hypothetical protein
MRILRPGATNRAVLAVSTVAFFIGSCCVDVGVQGWVSPLILHRRLLPAAPTPANAAASACYARRCRRHRIRLAAAVNSHRRNVETAATSSSTCVSDSFQQQHPATTECDNENIPPSLRVLLQGLEQLTGCGSSDSGSQHNTDIRGRFVEHKAIGSVANVSHSMVRAASSSQQPLLTPFAAYCIGNALGLELHDELLLVQEPRSNEGANSNGGGKGDDDEKIATVAIGVDPRGHGIRLADSLARGIEAVGNVRVHFCGLATTPACAAFCRMKDDRCDAAVVCLYNVNCLFMLLLVVE